MTRQIMDLRSEIGIAYLDHFYEKLEQKRSRVSYLPGIEEIRHDLWVAGRGPIPARVVSGRAGRDDYLRLYVDGRYALILNETNNGRGYLIGDVHPLRLGDQDLIVRGGLGLLARRWHLYGHPGSLPQHLDSRWVHVQNAWRACTQAPSGGQEAGLPARHARYLDQLDPLIEEARRIELSGAGSSRLCRYRRVDPAAALRRTPRSIYKFQLMGESRLTTGARVHVEGEPDLRGEVQVIEESLVTIHFDRPIDFNLIPRMGAFVASPNTLTFDKQAETVEILREGRSRNPRLLHVLADHAFQPFRPTLEVLPQEGLDSSQLSAFHKALAVPDMALVQGPPGTGKTRTIKQLIYECSTKGNKVLVSAYTNQAVDNVLKDLPTNLIVLRVGSGVTAACEHLTLEAQAVRLQKHILDRTEPVVRRYAAADPKTGEATQRLRELDYECGRLAEADARDRVLAQELAMRDAEVTAVLRGHLQALSAAAAQHRAALDNHERRIANLTTRRDRAVRRTEMPLIGGLFRGWAGRVATDLHTATAEAAQARHALDLILHDQGAAEAEIGQLRAAHPELIELRRRLDALHTECRMLAERAASAARLLSGHLGNADTFPEIIPDPGALARFQSAAEQAMALARRRLRLLTEWRGRLERRTDQLYGELVRYADVVGATCIGAASSQHLNDVGFELAIIDEASQISAPNLLVPLVRARRAVLVGDHLQLPPFHEQELVDWARRKDPELVDLVTKSAFELLFPHVPPDSREVLRYQRRMPDAVAAFISSRFYGGFLETAVERPLRDDLFASSIAFVDTARVPDGERRERPPHANEPWPEKSYVNDLEAQIITELVAYYHARGGDWVVVVPFSAQVGKVTALLADRLGDEGLAASRVASVDSFQGGEHDTVIFGFTRSNGGGSIGFLKDVRRANVAFSRARHRLIMVGDLSTLLNATDAGFRTMAEALHDHVQRRGDLRDCREVIARLAGEAGQ